MVYRVLVDGNDILDYTQSDMILLSPHAEIELDVSGSFEFTIPPNHIYYDRFSAESIMKMLVEIYEDTTLHWFGRPIELHLDFYKNKKIYCEGALGFFNDSVIREAEYEDTLLSVIFAAVIAEHNSMVDANRQFTVGQFTVADHQVYRKFNYEQTSDVLKSKFLDAEEGHFFVRRENGVNYIDFLKDMPYTCDQAVQFAKNLLNFTYSFDGKDFATCVIPLGGNDSETGKPITIASVNNSSDILEGNAAANYGKIVKVQQYSDLTDPYELMSEGQKYLTNLAWNAYLIECSAVDLHSMTQEVEDVVIEEGDSAPDQLFRVGQKVTCVSNPHGINLDLPISKMTLYLDSAAKQITLGRIPKKTLSRFYKDKVGTSTSESENENEIPDGFAIVPDPETGDPTLAKVPVTMQIMTLPYRDGSQSNSSYQYGNTLQFEGLTAKLVAKGQSQHGNEQIVYFVDSHYDCVTGVIPFNELSFDPTTYNQHAGKIMVWCTWTNPSGLYNGVKFKKAFYMHSLSEQALEDADVPDHITIVVPPAKLEYYTGGHVLLAGAKVVAYRSNGEPYTGSGYSNGVIPHTDLSLNPSIADIEKAKATYTYPVYTQDDYENGVEITSLASMQGILLSSLNVVPTPEFSAAIANIPGGCACSVNNIPHFPETNFGAGGLIDIYVFPHLVVGSVITPSIYGERILITINYSAQRSDELPEGKIVLNSISRSEVEAYNFRDLTTFGASNTNVNVQKKDAIQEITVNWAGANGSGTLSDTFEIQIKESQHGR